MTTRTIAARMIDAGTTVILPNGEPRTVAAVDDTATHVYVDWADGGSGIYALGDVVTVLPAHLAPDACFVCGRRGEHAPTDMHAYWSNADAMADAYAHDARTVAPDAAAAYVAQYRPY